MIEVRRISVHGYEDNWLDKLLRFFGVQRSKPYVVIITGEGGQKLERCAGISFESVTVSLYINGYGEMTIEFKRDGE